MAAILDFLFSIYIIINFNVFLTGCDDAKEKGELIFAHVIFRHGDRTPIEPYPNDPWGDQKYWPTGWGQLTNTGKRQHYELGQWLRKRYKGLVNETYAREEISIRSTDVDRTLMSALSNLAGFYPPVGKDVWNENIQWQPIPIHTKAEKDDEVLAAKKSCPAYDYLLKKLKKSDEWQKLNKELSGLYEYLTVNTGKAVKSLTDVNNIYNCLWIESLYNKTLPDWTNEVYPDKMAWVSSRSFATNTYTPELARLKTGPLLKEILIRSQNKTISQLKPNRSIQIYSAHDTTVANILNTLGLFEYHNPPYAACVMIELRMIKKIPFISVFYKNTTETPKAMYIPNCGTKCPLNKMFEIYKNVLPVDWDSECRMSMLSMTYDEANITPALLVILCLGLSILLLLIGLSFLITYMRRRDYQDARWYLRVDS